jgi:hypothetical protein
MSSHVVIDNLNMEKWKFYLQLLDNEKPLICMWTRPKYPLYSHNIYFNFVNDMNNYFSANKMDLNLCCFQIRS